MGRPTVSQPPPDAEVEGIALDLERYVSGHPAAADTVEGIARWWLTRQLQPPLSQVEIALDWLVRRGVLTRRRLPDGNCLYARAAPASDA